MSLEHLHHDIAIHANKTERYSALLAGVKAIIDPEDDIISNISNVVALLYYSIAPLWLGIYVVKGDELILYPFQGPVACTRIGKGKGVCGSAWSQDKTIVVKNVDQFPGHIACSSSSKSEIVVPIRNTSSVVVGVLDIDSTQVGYFDEADRIGLEPIADELGKLF